MAPEKQHPPPPPPPERRKDWELREAFDRRAKLIRDISDLQLEVAFSRYRRRASDDDSD